MPLYRITYSLHGHERKMTFAALADPEAQAFAHGVLGKLIGVPIDSVCRVEARPYHGQYPFAFTYVPEE